MKRPLFGIGEIAYHVTPESPKGIVLDARYSLLRDEWTYIVAFSIRDNETVYSEHELTKERNIL